MTIPEIQPPLGSELTWRTMRRDDAAAVAVLFDACFEADGGYRITPAEVETEFDLPELDPELDTLLGLDGNGMVVAMAWVIVPGAASQRLRVFAWNLVHPGYRNRGVGSFLLAWWESRGRQLASTSHLPAVFRQHSYEWQHDHISLLQDHGYRPDRYFTELARDLSLPISDVRLPPFIRIESWTTSTSDQARLVSNHAFEDHWGSEPVSAARWTASEDEFFVPTASAVAFDGDQAVSFISCSIYPHDFDDKARTEGWIERLGTLRSHRGLGIATALINRAMEVLADRGMEVAALGVDSANPTGALSLYKGLGFVAERRSVAYVKEVGTG